MGSSFSSPPPINENTTTTTTTTNSNEKRNSDLCFNKPGVKSYVTQETVAENLA